MPERVMVVTGAFATHTTKLYNYYVCPRNWNINAIGYIVVVYFGELKYIGKINRIINWSFNNPNRTFAGLSGNQLDRQITNDLQKFEAVLNIGDHYLFELISISNPCSNGELIRYEGTGAFTMSHRYFNSLNDFLIEFSNNSPDDQNIQNTNFSTNNEGEVTN